MTHAIYTRPLKRHADPEQNYPIKDYVTEKKRQDKKLHTFTWDGSHYDQHQKELFCLLAEATTQCVICIIANEPERAVSASSDQNGQNSINIRIPDEHLLKVQYVLISGNKKLQEKKYNTLFDQAIFKLPYDVVAELNRHTYALLRDQGEANLESAVAALST